MAALRGSQACLKEMLREYSARRAFVLQALKKIPNVSCVPPQGAFYVFPNISSYCQNGLIKSSIDFARYLLEEAHVAVVPGVAFGMEGFVRISYATSMSQLEEGFKRIHAALERLLVTVKS
jgi:aspartate aminotransferase